jgi:hypothetical protein
VRCAGCKRWPEPDRAVGARGTGHRTCISPCPLLTGEGSPRLRFVRSDLWEDNPTINPRLRNLPYSPPVPPDQGGYREASCGRAGERCPWRKGLAPRSSAEEPRRPGGSPGPAGPESTARHQKRTARGVRIAAVQPLRHFDIDIRHGGESCRIRTPRSPWEAPFQKTLAAEAGGDLGASEPRRKPLPLVGRGWGGGRKVECSENPADRNDVYTPRSPSRGRRIATAKPGISQPVHSGFAPPTPTPPHKGEGFPAPRKGRRREPYPTACAVAMPATRPENRQPPRKVPSSAR